MDIGVGASAKSWRLLVGTVSLSARKKRNKNCEHQREDQWDETVNSRNEFHQFHLSASLSFSSDGKLRCIGNTRRVVSSDPWPDEITVVKDSTQGSFRWSSFFNLREKYKK